MNPNEPPTPEDLEKDLQDVFAQLAAGRLDSLAGLKDEHVANHALWEHEALRLERKLGRDHPRLAQVQARLAQNRDLIHDLEAELEAASIQPAEMADDEALIEGRLVDEYRRGLDRLVVTLEDEHGQAVGAVSQAETSTAGYYVLRVNRDVLEKQPELRERGVFVVIRTNQGELVERTLEPIVLDRGVRLNLSATFNRADLGRTAEPHPAPAGPTRRPASTVWTVRGQVVDDQGEPAAGMLVRLFDKDQRFDERLGSVLTDVGGAFEMAYRDQDFKDYAREQPDLYLTVSDSSGNLLFTSEQAVRFNARKTEEFTVRLRRPGPPPHKAKRPVRGR